MKRRLPFGFGLLYLLVAYFCSCSAFYLPGLAPVSFCEEGNGGEDCQVCLFYRCYSVIGFIVFFIVCFGFFGIGLFISSCFLLLLAFQSSSRPRLLPGNKTIGIDIFGIHPKVFLFLDWFSLLREYIYFSWG